VTAAPRPSRWSDEHRRRGDDGLTLVELMVAFTALLVLFGLMGSVLSTYLSAGTTVTSSYTATDQLLPSSIIIQRLLRSQVEPAPTLTTTVAGACGATNVPCPAFPPATVGSYSTTFYANVGSAQGANGPAKIVMGLSTPTQCAGCKFPTAQFTVTEFPAASGCPTTLTATTQCTFSASGTRLVTVNNVTNGLTLCSGTLTLSPCPGGVGGPIFTYNTLDPYSATYTPNAGGTPSATPAGAPSGILPNFATCAAPTTNGNGDPTSSNCPADTIQSVQVDLQVQVQGAPMQENSFSVYRLSSSSYLYSTLVG